MNGFPWLEFLGLMAAFGVAVVVPGADFAMVLRQSIQHGRRAGIFAAAGIAASVLVHGTYTILGVGLIVGQSILVFDILKWAGAAYLIWLGIAALRSAPPQPPGEMGQAGGKPVSDFRSFGLGFLTNLLNPKAVLFFLSLFTTLVSAGTPSAIKVGYLLCMSGMLIGWFSLVSVFFTVPEIRQGFFKLGRWFNRITGVTFIVLAVRVALARPQ